MFFGIARFELVFVVAFKYLVIGKNGHFRRDILEALKQGNHNGFVVDGFLHFFENSTESLGLFRRRTGNEVGVAFAMIVIEVGNQLVKLSVKRRLWALLDEHQLFCFGLARAGGVDPVQGGQLFAKCRFRQKQLFWREV